MKLRLSVLATLVAVLIVTPGAPASSNATYYLSLGDSLAQGYQPIGGPLKSGNAPPGYNQGYADQLFRLTRDRFEQLREVKLGCGGETTTTLRFGGICTYEQGSQLAAAEAFLDEHGDEVALVTIDIGGNDAISGGGIAEIAANLPTILGTLRDAAAPSVQIVGMNYYHPFLPLVWFQTHDLGALQAEVSSAVAFNDFLEGMFQAFGVKVADVESAFSLTDLTVQGDGLPLNVRRGCDWTWICSDDDLHPNTDGYGVIAEAFADVLTP
jgi:lysophospholipase L1-like esterase